MIDDILCEIYNKFCLDDNNFKSELTPKSIMIEKSNLTERLREIIPKEHYVQIEDIINKYAYLTEEECFIQGYKEAIKDLKQILEKMILFVSI
ncbi:hypothetical protein [Anaerofustis stercorihominis]|uniref:hypothetical protein n=1 Tax=Anaerofustis stercorihominis TaxID=214853 RepID=UPI00214C7BF6|nr:hypothetical protein [Anaerofustis stercorihominis]MCR2033600.1 hypothetical protein [Anaerofustis stercorihominis]